PPEEVLEPSWNVAPTDRVYAVVQRENRQLRVLRWGLVPSWAKDPKVGARFINARQETVATAGPFRVAYAKRRCLLPADGYFEWQPVGGEKQPWFLTSQDRQPLAMAGLYEHWKAPDDTWLSTCTILTTSAPDELGEIHDRTPLLVPREAWALWLAPDVAAPDGLLIPGTSGVLDAWPVHKDVGSVRNNGAYLVDPL
ncbi:MAG TPA: SOS response-associated peptidase, partial [Candidatus Dormibacteraeota bacterium]|nr:SOS response-associated peptidase [Candidatus Dormibacteraeota bacterium]